MTTRVTNLTAMNVRALIEECSPFLVTTSATTATFTDDPIEALSKVDAVLMRLTGRGHPKASLHAVRRKLLTATQEMNR